MQFYLISDNVDTQIGMRLAGINGIVVHDQIEVENALKKAIKKDSIAIILITEKLVSLCPELIYEIKLKYKKPLIVEIPDRHGFGRGKDSITKYVTEAIGVKF